MAVFQVHGSSSSVLSSLQIVYSILVSDVYKLLQTLLWDNFAAKSDGGSKQFTKL